MRTSTLFLFHQTLVVNEPSKSCAPHTRCFTDIYLCSLSSTCFLYSTQSSSVVVVVVCGGSFYLCGVGVWGAIIRRDTHTVEYRTYWGGGGGGLPVSTATSSAGRDCWPRKVWKFSILARIELWQSPWHQLPWTRHGPLVRNIGRRRW